MRITIRLLLLVANVIMVIIKNICERRGPAKDRDHLPPIAIIPKKRTSPRTIRKNMIVTQKMTVQKARVMVKS